MRTLIADDDAEMCGLIREVIRSLGDAEIVEANNGEDALALAAQGNLDLVLLDWNMPGRSGLEVAQAIRRRGSDVPIIMVTGVSQRTKVVEAVAVGISDFIVKPFDPGTLQERVGRYWKAEGRTGIGTGQPAAGAVSAIAQRDDSSGSAKANLHGMLQRIEYVSTLPDIAIRAMAVANDPSASVTELKTTLEGDPAITARVLRYVNSAANSNRKGISDLTQAITLLGMTQVRHLILAAAVSDLFKAKGGINAYRRLNLWRHMASVAICARMIARKLSFANENEIFLAGLMHDIGIILEDQYLHPQFCKIIRGLEPSKTLIEVEREHLAFDHTNLGEVVATRWGFPESVRSAIRYHHESMHYDRDDKLPVRCVELANVICSFRGITSVGTNLVQPFDAEAGALKLSQANVVELAQELDRELKRHEALLHL